jgi:glycosyltransferase involved in cell wall biosynthesis
MKIGVIASIAHRLPPRVHSPREQITSALTEGFVARGHDVTLFATADSVTAASLQWTVPVGYDDQPDIDVGASQAMHNPAAFEQAAEFDIITNQFDFMALTYSRLVRTPMVTTIHGPSSLQVLPVYKAYSDIAHYVAVSESSQLSGLTYDATIHYGIDTEKFAFVAGAGEYLLCLAPIAPSYGTYLAIEVAKKARLPLVIAGPIADSIYFENKIKPKVNGVAVTYAGDVGLAERSALLGGARALLHLASRDEPFALNAVEALATGTPVIATPLGSLPELVRDGATGFIVPDVAAAASAVARLGTLDRAACRDDAVQRFGATQMVDAYVALFERILDARNPQRQSAAKPVGSPGLFSHASFG